MFMNAYVDDLGVNVYNQIYEHDFPFSARVTIDEYPVIIVTLLYIYVYFLLVVVYSFSPLNWHGCQVTRTSGICLET